MTVTRLRCGGWLVDDGGPWPTWHPDRESYRRALLDAALRETRSDQAFSSQHEKAHDALELTR